MTLHVSHRRNVMQMHPLRPRLLLRPPRSSVPHNIYAPHEVLESRIRPKIRIFATMAFARFPDLRVSLSQFRPIRQAKSLLESTGTALDRFATGLAHQFVHLER